jgi:hypothetical protein
MPRAGVRGGRGALSPEGHRQKCDLSAISAPESASSLLVPSLVTPTKFMRSTCVRFERGSLRLQRRRELPSQRTAARPLVCVEVGEEKPLLLAPVGVACNRRL